MFEWFKKLDKPESEFETDPETGATKMMQVTIGYHPKTKMYFVTLINKKTGKHMTAMMNLAMFVEFRNSITNAMIRFEGGLDIE